MKKTNPFYKIATLAFAVTAILGILYFVTLLLSLYALGGHNAGIGLDSLASFAQALKWLVPITLCLSIIALIAGYINSVGQKHDDGKL